MALGYSALNGHPRMQHAHLQPSFHVNSNDPRRVSHSPYPPTGLEQSQQTSISRHVGKPGRSRSASPLRGSGPATPSAGSSARSDRDRPRQPRDIPACDRCRSFKKKCSRTFPTCSLCASANQQCSFSTPASSPAAQLHHLRARIDWLSRFINDSLSVGTAGVEALDTGVNLLELYRSSSTSKSFGLLEQRPPPTGPTFPNHDGSSMADQQMADGPNVNINSGGSFSRPLNPCEANASVKPLRVPLPADAAARRFVDAYFGNVNRAYPFVEREKVLTELETLGDFASRRRDPDSTLLYLIMAIGCTTLQRAGQIPSDTASKFDVPYSTIIQECLARDSIESVQILLLLAIYSLFDASGTSPFSVVGIVCRQAVLLGLTRRVSDDRGATTPTEVELRHRLFWSIYVMDRMTAAALGLPVALTDEDTDVPLPSLTVTEFASPERSSAALNLQINRHVIQVRQLEDRILRAVHFRSRGDVSALSAADRRAILHDIRAAIDNWYTSCCLTTPLEPAADNVPIHNSITWLSARYYHLLMLLYYPCRFNSFLHGPVASLSLSARSELLRFAQKHLQSTAALFQQRQLPLNRVTLARVFPVGLVLMHGFIACAGEGAFPFPAREEVAFLVTLLETFPEAWWAARGGAHIFCQFLALMDGVDSQHRQHQQQQQASSSYHSSSAYDNGTPSPPSRETCLALVRPIMSALRTLMQDVLGRASCFLFSEQDRPDGREISSAGQPVHGGPGSTPSEASFVSRATLLAVDAPEVGEGGEGEGVMWGDGTPELHFIQ